MKPFPVLVAFVMVFLVSLPGEAQLPPEVAELLEQAVDPSETDEFTGSFTMTLDSVVQKPNGKRREEMQFECEVVNLHDGTQDRHLLRFIENGEDVTEEQRKDFEKLHRADDEDHDENGDDTDFADPYGPTGHLYQFGEVVAQGAEMVISFEPAPEHEDNPELARGRVGWDPGTMHPRWLEMEAVRPPKPLKQLVVRIEFVSVGDRVYVSRMVSDGLAKVLLMQRQFNMDMGFDNIRPAASERP